MKFLSYIFLLLLISCNSNSYKTSKKADKHSNKIIQKDNFVGKWIECGYKKGEIINIELIDGNYVIKDNKYGSEWVFTKKSVTLIQAWDGLISFRFESKSGHLKLIDGGPTEEYKKLNN